MHCYSDILLHTFKHLKCHIKQFYNTSDFVHPRLTSKLKYCY